MWHRLSSFILRYRIILLVFTVLLTGFMGLQARKMKMSYRDLPLLPKKDSAYIDFDKFKSTFGEEGNLIVIGITDNDFFKLDHFLRWRKLCNDLKNVGGVEDMLNVTNSYKLVKNTKKKKFDFQKIFADSISSQQQLDSMAADFKSMPIYRHYLYNDSTKAYLVVLTMNKDKIRTAAREGMVLDIRNKCADFEKDTNIHIRYSG